MTNAAHGLLAEFGNAERLLDAVRRARDDHYDALEAYTPVPVAGLDDALGHHDGRIPLLVLLGGIFGGASTYALQVYSAVFDYPINVGGRPTFSWPAFVPAAVEMAILFAVLFGVAGMLIGNRLPRLHHPLFALGAFERASRDRFFLLVRADDPRFDSQATRDFLATLAPLSIIEVAP